MLGEFLSGLGTYHFLQNALVTALVIGLVAGALGPLYCFAFPVPDGGCHFPRCFTGSCPILYAGN